MATCVPVRDLKNTAAFTQLVERKRDVTVTKNGYDVLHCLNNDEYALLQDEALKAKLLARILLAEDEINQGAFGDFDSFASSIRQDYGL